MCLPLPTETVYLKRLDRKLWQFDSASPKRVELAALNYYKSKGWKGYFTEQADHFSLLSYVAGWGDWSGRCPKSLDGIYDLLERSGYRKTLENIRTTDPRSLSRNLYIAVTKSKDKYHLRFLQREMQRIDEAIDELMSFFYCVGSDGILKEIEFRLPQGRIKNLRAIQKFDRELYRYGYENKLVYPEGAIWIVGGKESDYSRRSEQIIRFAEETGNVDLLRKAQIAIRLAKTEMERLNDLNSLTKLDLVLWKNDQIAYVEVKAPNDRLSKEQCNTIKRNVEEGTLSWVAYVEEIGETGQ